MAAKKSAGKKTTKTRKKRKTSKSRRSGKLFAAAAAVVVGLLCLAGILIENGTLQKVIDQIKLPPVGQDSGIKKDESFDFGVYFIDVGQGDCELIVSGDTTVLIDAGESENGVRVVNALRYLGIDRLDYVIATHPHSDHIGGLPYVIDKFEVGKVIAPRVDADKTPTTNVYEKFIDSVKAKGMKLTAAKAGTVYDIDGATLEILAPVGSGYSDLNDYSVVCRAVKGNTSFMFTGDASEAAELDMLLSGEDLSADLLKVGHHGSRSSSSAEFLQRVSPSVCVISCGAGNDYGHPTDEAMDRLMKYTSKIYRTDLNGTVTVYSDGEKLYVKTEE